MDKATPTPAPESFLRTAEQCGIAHNGGAAGQYVLVATTGQLQKLVERLAAQAAPTERASSGAAQAAPFAKDSWQHAVDNQLVAFGRTSQEFANPHEAIAWLAIMNMELGQSNVGAAQAVRMLTREELNDVALSEQVGWGPGEYVEAVQLALLRVNAGRTIPADGVIGGAA